MQKRSFCEARCSAYSSPSSCEFCLSGSHLYVKSRSSDMLKVKGTQGSAQPTGQNGLFSDSSHWYPSPTPHSLPRFRSLNVLSKTQIPHQGIQIAPTNVKRFAALVVSEMRVRMRQRKLPRALHGAGEEPFTPRPGVLRLGGHARETWQLALYLEQLQANPGTSSSSALLPVV
jgi:hypothetical protein